MVLLVRQGKVPLSPQGYRDARLGETWNAYFPAKRVVPFPSTFKETLALHIDAQRRGGAVFLFESSWNKPYSDRSVRKILTRYTQAAGITASISLHTLRHFLFTWLKSQGIDDALIQPYSGHATRQSLEIYSRLALADAQQRHDDVIGDFPV